MKDENENLKSKIKTGNISKELKEDFKRNETFAEFLWKRSCQVSSLLFDIQKEKKLCSTLRFLNKFLPYYKEEFSLKIEEIYNGFIHNLPDFNKLKRRLWNIQDYENENNDLSRKLFFTEQKLRKNERYTNLGFIYHNIRAL